MDERGERSDGLAAADAAQQETVGTVRAALEAAYPVALAEDWDRVGLVCGDPDAPVRRVAFALDPTLEVARDAIACGADMLVCHHPLLLRGVSSVAADTPKGRVVHELIRAGVALYAAHTNADAARPGVNDRLAELLGVTPGRPIVPTPGQTLDSWQVVIPVGDVERVARALFDAGAGAIGSYSHASFSAPGRETFRPRDGARPAVGEVGEDQRVAAELLSFVAPRARRAALEAALREAHPYECPAYHWTETALPVDPEHATGLGRVGRLERPVKLAEFTQRVADALPETAWGVRAVGDPDEMIETVAVCSGSGDSFLDTVRGLDVDCYVTSDLRHHPVDEYRRAGGPAVIDTAHYASEFPWTAAAADVVRAACAVDTHIIERRTDPWTLSAHPRRERKQ